MTAPNLIPPDDDRPWPGDEVVSANDPIDAGEADPTLTPSPETARIFTRNAATASVQWSRGDHVELALHCLAKIEGDGEPLVFDDGNLVHFLDITTGLWKTIDLAEQSRVVQGFAGTLTIQGEGKPKPLRIHAGDVTGAIKLAHDQATKPGFFGTEGRG